MKRHIIGCERPRPTAWAESYDGRVRVSRLHGPSRDARTHDADDDGQLMKDADAAFEARRCKLAQRRRNETHPSRCAKAGDEPTEGERPEADRVRLEELASECDRCAEGEALAERRRRPEVGPGRRGRDAREQTAKDEGRRHDAVLGQREPDARRER